MVMKLNPSALDHAADRSGHCGIFHLKVILGFCRFISQTGAGGRILSLLELLLGNKSAVKQRLKTRQLSGCRICGYGCGLHLKFHGP